MAIPTRRAIDIYFDFRSDTPPGGDPDAKSKTLKEYHRLLWSKPLPDGRAFTLSDSTGGVYLHHKSEEIGEFRLSSDTMANSQRKRLSHFYAQVSPGVNAAFHHLGYTIGGMIVFPGNMIDGKNAINQERGMNPRIADRLDLTLECISRHYRGATSPSSARTTGNQAVSRRRSAPPASSGGWSGGLNRVTTRACSTWPAATSR